MTDCTREPRVVRIPATAHIHQWIAGPSESGEWWCAVNDCEVRYPKGWTVGDKPTVATTGTLITAVREYIAAEQVVADAERALRAARQGVHRACDAMHTAGAEAGVDNAVPSRRWPDVVEWVRLGVPGA